MKFETPKMDIFIFSSVIVTVTSSVITNKRTVVEAKNTLMDGTNQVEANNILTFTFSE